ncbi:MAG: M48 family metalloprotease [Planctomycetes bacterium]|nr:M48 family metalloprotease [Planctomycetota bacterium]
MLLPIDTIAAIMILLAYIQEGGSPAPRSAYDALGWLGAIALTIPLSLYLAGRITEIFVNRKKLGSTARRSAAGALDVAAKVMVIALFWTFLKNSDWPFTITSHMGITSKSGITECIFGLLPYIIFSIGSWLPLYRIHRECTPDNWSMRSFLVHKAQYSFFILLLAIPTTFMIGYINANNESISNLVSPMTIMAGIYIMLFLCVWTFPFLLTMIWGCKKLPQGKLRSRVNELEEKAGVRFSNIFIWNLGGGTMVNAAAVGLFPPFRYLFLSRALIEKLSEEEIDGVVCHEMGHVRHRHLLFYMLVTIALMETFESMIGSLSLSPLEQVPLVVIVLAAYIRFGFAFISRRMERQADLTSLDILGSATPLVRALEKIGAAYGNIRAAKSWHHMSIAERVAFLKAAENNPEIGIAHHDHVRAVKAAGYYLAATLIAVGIMSHYAGDMREKSATVVPMSGFSESFHWQRVSRLMPDEMAGPLQLARLCLQSDEPDRKEKASILLQDAITRNGSAAEIRAATALIDELKKSPASAGGQTTLDLEAPRVDK